MERARVLRFVRIAVTAISLTACVLLIALWVRSYSFRDLINGRLSTGKGFIATSWQGRVSFCWASNPEFVANLRWTYSAKPAELHARTMRMHLLEEQRAFVASGGSLTTRAPTEVGFLGFYSANLPDLGWKVLVPYWFLVVIAGISALLATIFALPKLFRFSLRTLLIATALVAVVLGTVFYFSG